MDTNILFMGYWLLKRNLLSIDLKLKLDFKMENLYLKIKKKLNQLKLLKYQLKKYWVKNF